MPLTIEPRVQDIGFPVKRLLPSRHKQRVGPFIFFDHMGPATFKPDTTEGDVRQHPHIGLATVTYLFSGSMMHRDSLGVVERIEPGAINLMTAGRGIVHSERMPADLRASGTQVEGIQTWLALPLENENDAPDFQHYAATDIPEVKQPGLQVKVLIGCALGVESPVKTASKTLYLDIQLDVNSELKLDFASLGSQQLELAVYLVKGEVSVQGQPLRQFDLQLLADGDRISAQQNARLMLIGGEPLAGERYIFWNFVASSKAKLNEASERWEKNQFELVPGETEKIPLPKM